MTGTMKAVADDLFGVNKAADEFSVPRPTLNGRLSGKIVHGVRSGPAPYPSGVEEDKLVKIPSLPPGLDEGGVSGEDLDGDLHNERQGDDPSATDDPSMNRPGDDDRSGEGPSLKPGPEVYQK